MTTLPSLQDDVDVWIEQHGGYWSTLSMMTRLIEETGELATVINTRHGDKPGNDSRADLRLEFGDVLFTLICLANTLDIDMEAVLTETMKKYDRSED